MNNIIDNLPTDPQAEQKVQEHIRGIDALRDQFAMAALTALVPHLPPTHAALRAYKYADAMLQIRNKDSE